jgi:antitoxin HicB
MLAVITYRRSQKVPLVMTIRPEGGYTVTSPALPELVTEGDTLEEALAHVKDALVAVVELYEDLGKPLPTSLRQDPQAWAIRFEYAVMLA